MQRVIGGTGFVLIILGIACAGSQTMLIPVALIAAGAVMVGVSARWTEK